MATGYDADIEAIQSIATVPTILEVVCRTTGMGFAAVARVTDDRWIACGVRDTIDFGLQPGGELKVETTICNDIKQSRQPVVIDNVAKDAAYCGHRTPAMYGFQSYISMPIVLPDGRFFGTLCAIDPAPARVNTPATIGMFKLFAELIAFHLDAHERLAVSESRLLDEERTSQLREQFIAVLGHDLRNPLASIDSGARMLLRTRLDDKAVEIVRLLQSSASRMGDLIENVLDLARGRLGGGLPVERRAADLQPALLHVVAELQAAHPARSIETDIAVGRPVTGDVTRLSQLLSNLVANALAHGAPGAPVYVQASTKNGTFELAVHNSGDPIPQEALAKLFEPFERGSVRANQQGLGLGLYIASEIARAHHGRLAVESSAERTSFTFTMPVGE